MSNEKDNSNDEQDDIRRLDSKKSSIATFLLGVWNDDSFSEFDPSNPTIRRISNFHRKKDVFLFYCEILLENNEGNNIPSFQYFTQIWIEDFPNLGNILHENH